MAMPNNYSNCLYPMVKILYISYYVLFLWVTQHVVLISDCANLRD